MLAKINLAEKYVPMNPNNKSIASVNPPISPMKSRIWTDDLTLTYFVSESLTLSSNTVYFDEVL